MTLDPDVTLDADVTLTPDEALLTEDEADRLCVWGVAGNGSRF